MANYIETRIKYEKMQQNGAVKRTTESYIVDAMSFTEAESRITEEQRPFISGEFTVSAVKKSNIAEIFRDASGDKWYRCKLMFITIDERTATEKRTATHILVQAVDFRTALNNLVAGMNGTMADYDIAEIVETKIMDVYAYRAAGDSTENNATNE